jgi:hypothetical protein
MHLIAAPLQARHSLLRVFYGDRRKGRPEDDRPTGLSISMQKAQRRRRVILGLPGRLLHRT